jgi:hypothetical protein
VVLSGKELVGQKERVAIIQGELTVKTDSLLLLEMSSQKDVTVLTIKIGLT